MGLPQALLVLLLCARSLNLPRTQDIDTAPRSRGPAHEAPHRDLLLQHACAEDAAAGHGPTTAFPFVGKDSPLLPNLGVANIPAYLMDILVRSLLVYYMDRLSDVSDAISDIYYVDDGLVRCEGAYSGRDASPVALRGVEGRGG